MCTCVDALTQLGEISGVPIIFKFEDDFEISSIILNDV